MMHCPFHILQQKYTHLYEVCQKFLKLTEKSGFCLNLGLCLDGINNINKYFDVWMKFDTVFHFLENDLNQPRKG